MLGGPGVKGIVFQHFGCHVSLKGSRKAMHNPARLRGQLRMGNMVILNAKSLGGIPVLRSASAEKGTGRSLAKLWD